MSRTLKRRMAVIAAAFLLVAIGITTLFGLKTNQADALSIGYADRYSKREVYYFSDSQPTFYERMRSYNPFYDIHGYISVEEFEFMVYGGYFMGFDSDYIRALVVIQLATIKPSEQTLNDLFYCLHFQNCLVMFLTPFKNEYGNLECDFTLLCPLDNYDLFLRNSAAAMYSGFEILNSDAEDDVQFAQADSYMSSVYNANESSDMGPTPPIPEPNFGPSRLGPDGISIPCNSVLFLDGRMVGVWGYEEELDIRCAYLYSREFRRLLAYMRYGYDTYDYNPCEEGIYDYLWEAYSNLPVFIEYGIGFSSRNRNIDEAIEAWTTLYECGESYRWYQFWYAYNLYYYDEQYKEVYGEFIDYYLYIIGEYYNSEFVDFYAERYTRIYAHSDGDKYYSLFEFKDDGVGGATYKCKDYHYADYNEFLDKYPLEEPERPHIDYVYAMGIINLKHDFHSFLYGFRQYISNQDNSAALVENEVYSKGLTIFVWVEDSVVWDPDGLVVVTSQYLKDYYGQENGYDYEYWWMLLHDYLEALLSQLW